MKYRAEITLGRYSLRTEMKYRVEITLGTYTQNIEQKINSVEIVQYFFSLK